MRELVVGRLTKVWGGSSTGRASVLQAEGQGFKPPSLHGSRSISSITEGYMSGERAGAAHHLSSADRD